MYTRWWIPEFVVRAIGRSACRTLGWHGVTCRGRVDHDIETEWHPILKWMGC